MKTPLTTNQWVIGPCCNK